MKKIIFFVAYSLLISTAHSRPENETPKSGRWISPLGENAAIGMNGDSKAITGFYHYVNRAMPGYLFHADFTILFSGKLLKNNIFSIYAIDTGKPSSKSVSGILFFGGSQKFSSKALAEQLFRIKLNENLPSCSDAVDVSDFELQFSTNNDGDWKYVSAVRTKRAYFHSEPSDSTVDKAFLVAGDLIYIYDENPGWYYVKYQGRKKETVGWIKKSDTIQLP
jgi:hypothetical protein